MDKITIDYYNKDAEVLYHTYQSAHGGVKDFFSTAFNTKSRILDIGAGSGRDMIELLKTGHDVYGIDGSESLVQIAKKNHPALADRLVHRYFPDLENPFGKTFDGVLCSALLMHIPKEQLFDSVYAIKRLLNKNGKLLLSVPTKRDDILENQRDKNGRLFLLYTVEYLQLIFERAGFQLLEHRINQDTLNRTGIEWAVLLFRLEDNTTLRPLDQIEGILNRDRKTATYKLALFRALCDISMTSFHSAIWNINGTVGIPIHLITERWIEYYWKIFESIKYIPQHNGESKEKDKIKFRFSLNQVIQKYKPSGGYNSYLSSYKNSIIDSLEKTAFKTVTDTLIKGPITYSGGSLETGRIFIYDKENQFLIMPASFWKEISLMNHWIKDALLLRWAELTENISHGEVKAGEVISILLKDSFEDRDVYDAKIIYDKLPNKECIWSGKIIYDKYAVDHVIPYSLWHNNDLWNLVPANEKVNLQKSDKLPQDSLLKRRKEQFIHYWSILKESYTNRFNYEARQFCGAEYKENNWENLLFASLLESIEVTALQRGVERWAI